MDEVVTTKDNEQEDEENHVGTEGRAELSDSDLRDEVKPLWLWDMRPHPMGCIVHSMPWSIIRMSRNAVRGGSQAYRGIERPKLYSILYQHAEDRRCRESKFCEEACCLELGSTGALEVEFLNFENSCTN